MEIGRKTLRQREQYLPGPQGRNSPYRPLWSAGDGLLFICFCYIFNQRSDVGECMLCNMSGLAVSV